MSATRPILAAPRRVARRIHGSTAGHRMFPAATGVQLAKLRADRAWESPVLRATAQQHMRYLLGRSSRADSIDALAQRYLAETYKRAELRWRPWVTTRQPVDNIERLHAAVASKHGVLLSFMHHGQYDGMFGSLGGRSLGMRAAGHAELMAGQHFDYRKRHSDTVRLGAELFDVSAGFASMLAMLQNGDLLALASDLPSSGSHTVDLLGRQVRAATGAARLSHDSGALVVVVTAHKDGGLQRLQVHEPFGARDFESFDGVQAEIFARHTPALLAWPEAFEQPLMRSAPTTDDEAEFGGLQLPLPV